MGHRTVLAGLARAVSLASWTATARALDLASAVADVTILGARGGSSSAGDSLAEDHGLVVGGLNDDGFDDVVVGARRGYFLVVTGCSEDRREAEGSCGRSNDLRVRVERPSTAMLGTQGCP